MFQEYFIEYMRQYTLLRKTVFRSITLSYINEIAPTGLTSEALTLYPKGFWFNARRGS